VKQLSFSSLANSIKDIFKRFPGAIIAAIIGSIFSILLSHQPYELTESNHWYWNIIMSCYLGMLLLIAITVFAEKKELSITKSLLLQLTGLTIAVAYYFTLPDQFINIVTIRFTLFALGFHCLIAFLPFSADGEMSAFWQYNKILFLRILTAFLYTGVLYIGLSLALLAMEKLFSITIESKLYVDLWIVLTGIFNTCFFLADFPKMTIVSEQSSIDYPKGLKIFTQYALLPIITIYLLILYAYLFKILLTFQWPMGWVSYMVLGFSVAGILSLLLIHPIRNEATNKWILTFSRLFYFALFPLLILLFFAIERRIREYGITELRYFVLVLALWLLFIATYFLASKQKNIKIIPQSLCLLAFLTSFGPWGAFSVSLHSQQNQLVKLLIKNALLANGKIIKADNKLPFKDRKQICSVTEYIVGNHGYQPLQSYFNQNLDSLSKSDSLVRNRYSYQKARKLLELMNISYINAYDREDVAESDNNHFDYNISFETKDVLKVEGFDYYISNYYYYFQNNNTNQDFKTFKTNNELVTICLDKQRNVLEISVNKDSAVIFNLDQMIKKMEEKAITKNDHLKEPEMTFYESNNSYLSQVKITEIKGTLQNNHLQITDMRATLLIGRRK
jgi:hypothetical protein